MASLEDQLNELIAQSDRVAAELNRELFLIGRADAAISYLRLVREQTAMQVAALLEQRAVGAIAQAGESRTERCELRASKWTNGFGAYDPNWPH
jgi:hypothetical protein